jgi:hypothetical protein
MPPVVFILALTLASFESPRIIVIVSRIYQNQVGFRSIPVGAADNRSAVLLDKNYTPGV